LFVKIIYFVILNLIELKHHLTCFRWIWNCSSWY